MHPKELLELAAVVASRASTFLQNMGPLPTAGLNQYWTASKCRLDRWATVMKSYQTANQQQQTQPQREQSWLTLRPTVEEILTGEVLTRVWAALLCQHDVVCGTNESTPVVRSVYLGHLEARHRALNILIYGRGFSQDESLSVNRLRRQCERWTELLLGLTAQFSSTAIEFAFDSKSFEQVFQAEHTGDSDIQEGLTASLRASFHHRLTGDAENGDLNEKIASGVLSCLDANTLAPGPAMSPWLRRLNDIADETTSTIQSLLDSELDSPAPKLDYRRRFEL
jgi:hypothetical protein